MTSKQSTPRITLTVMTLLLTFSAIVGAFAHTVKAAPLQQVKVDNPYGADLLLDSEVEPWKKERTFYLAAKANIPWVKQEFPWDQLEFSKGHFFDDKNNKSAWDKFDELVGYAEKYGLTMVARLDRTPDWARPANTTPGTPPTNTQDYVDFVTAFLAHYKGQVKYIQIWNEPNLRAEWDTGKDVEASEYVAMLTAVYDKVKAAYPDVQILSAPLAINLIKKGDADHTALNDLDYWRAMYAAGVKGKFDLASANTYGLRDVPDSAPDPGVLNYRRVELLHQIMADNGDGDKPIWFNEYGWNANPGPTTLTPDETVKYGQVTPQQQAQYTVQGIEYARKNWPWAGVIFIWYMRQEGLRFNPDNSQYYFALVNVDFTLNPVYLAVQQATAAYPGPGVSGNIPQPANPPAGTPVPPDPPALPTGNLPPTATPAVSAVATDTPAASVAPTDTPAAAITPTIALTATATISSPTATPTAPAKPGDNGSTLLLIVIGVVAVALIGAGVFLFMRKPNNEA